MEEDRQSYELRRVVAGRIKDSHTPEHAEPASEDEFRVPHINLIGCNSTLVRKSIRRGSRGL